MMISPEEALGVLFVWLMFLAFVGFPIFKMVHQTVLIRIFGVCKSPTQDAHKMEWDGKRMWFKCETCGTVAVDISHDRENVLK